MYVISNIFSRDCFDGTPLMGIGGPASRSLHPFSALSMRGNGKDNKQSGNEPHFSTPQEYLSSPMFESLNQRNGSGKNVLTWADRTITLRPLGQLKRKKNTLSKKLPVKNGCKVLWSKGKQQLSEGGVVQVGDFPEPVRLWNETWLFSPGGAHAFNG